jgi:hypothetical protein
MSAHDAVLTSFASFALAMAVAACSSSGGSSGGSEALAPCGALDTVMVSGTLDGQAVQETSPMNGFLWTNTGKGTFNGSWSDGSTHLEWATLVASGQEVSLTAATLTLAASSAPRTFRSGKLVYDSPHGATESTLRAALSFDTGDVTVCFHKKEQ